MVAVPVVSVSVMRRTVTVHTASGTCGQSICKESLVEYYIYKIKNEKKRREKGVLYPPPHIPRGTTWIPGGIRVEW
jgi:hypothetical protein